MKTYEIQFTGRRVNAQGKFYKIRAQVFAPDEAAAMLKLYDRFEHVQQPEVKEITSPFDADGLVNLIQNDEKEFNQVRRIAENIRQLIARNAYFLNKANANWHDDPESPDWGLYHADAESQFPQAERDKAALELLARHLEVLNENEAANTAREAVSA